MHFLGRSLGSLPYALQLALQHLPLLKFMLINSCRKQRNNQELSHRKR